MDIKDIKKSPFISFLLATLGLYVLTLFMFADTLFTSRDTVLSNPANDLANYFMFSIQFGYDQLRQGVFPLWNPHIFSGTPYFGAFQAALLYPLNLIYLLLPLTKGINTVIALHVFLIGIFMYLWAFYRKLHPLASFLCAVLIMFSGPYFLHIYSGHITYLCAMAWAPLIFLAIDGFLDKRSLGWIILGIFAVTMQTLAGYPQNVYYTAIAASIYLIPNIIRAKGRLKIILGFVSMYVAAFLLCAAQILPALDAAKESVRSSGLSYNFAAIFSFPPESYLTLFFPNFFGDNITFPYWGRWYLWEMSLFISLTGFFLALYGALYGAKNIRRFSVAMVFILSLFALGVYTPLFGLLYKFLPGYNLFRGNSKFIFQVSLFLVLLAGIGLDKMISSYRESKRLIFSIFFIGLIFLICGFLARYSALGILPDFWRKIISGIQSTRQSYLLSDMHTSINFIKAAGIFSSLNIFIASGLCFLIGILFFIRKSFPHTVKIIILVAILEIFIFARSSRATFLMKDFVPSEIKKFAANYIGDYRVLYTGIPNVVMPLGLYNIWGYEPGALGRYSDFIVDFTNFSQRRPNGDSTSNLHPLFKMLRCRYLISQNADKIDFLEIKDVLPRLILVRDYSVVPEKEKMLLAISDPKFDSSKNVFLEVEPEIIPEKTGEGAVRVINSSVNHLTVEGFVSSPAILVVTDSYSSGWRVKPLAGSVQQKYTLLPANYILQAIPLLKGYHKFRLEYAPRGFYYGIWISLTSLVIYLTLVISFLAKKRKKYLSYFRGVFTKEII